MNTGGLRYRAFISYSHRDERIAARLHRRIETYRAPSGLVAAARRRLAPVFRDRDELASAERLSASIEQALDESEALIVVCSPAAVASIWVGKEILYFRRTYPQRPVFAFVVDGDPGVDPRQDAATAAFPSSLILADPESPKGALGEPIAADAREQGDGFANAFLKLAAGLLQVRFDQLRNREQRRRQQRWAIAGSASLLLSAVFAVLAWQATVARDAARRAQAQAELELQSERQTRDFLLSVFQLADAGEARGNTVTVREVLDRAVARIDSTEFSRPAIKSRYLATMGRAYASLGLNRRSLDMLTQSIDALHGAPMEPELQSQRVDSLIELAAVQFDMGEYHEALQRLDEIEVLREAGAPPSPLQRIRAANIRGGTLTFMERDSEADEAFQQAASELKRIGSDLEGVESERARNLIGLALLQQFAGEHSGADSLYAQAFSALERSVGQAHPDSIGALISRGSNAHASGDTDAAQLHYLRALQLARRVYDEDSPQMGTLKNNLGRLHLERGELDAAEPLLRDALASDRRHRSETFDDLAYSLNNLAVLRIAQGDSNEATTLLEEALPIADEAEHAMLGPILANLADLRCAAGNAEDGLAMAERAVESDIARNGEAHWQSHYAALVLAACRAASGEPQRRVEVDRHLTAVRKRWPAVSPFATRAAWLHRSAGEKASRS
jgi:tetratricopeptide (TPR) repeat protein